ncbi:cGMP-dependent 3',5'-cyclic phosphodiesterase-like isoform X2 [Ischnura elegans]|uniref:cGMP-dependent 3',5'-cyclic phosphodiesterase-like isoform X2 n=1 Tax=Ischnura elegans TaxID=197161 RepID=UPI001ED88B60|nr:cGMP-dependent 3',5'-cyclic phosphodiesterase-like isoform X2 [Ischnura elegans]
MAQGETNLLRLCSTLNDKSSAELQIKVNNYLIQETGSQLAFLAAVLSETEELLIQVLGDKVLEEEKRFTAKDHAVGIPLVKNTVVHLHELEESDKEEIRTLLDFMPETFVAVPINHANVEQVAIIAYIVNFVEEAEGSVFRFIATIRECFEHTLGIILNTLAYEEERRLRIQCQSLLTVARNLFTHLSDISDLLREIMMEARKLTQAERCSLFLLDEERDELVAEVFDGIPAEPGNENAPEVRIAKTQGIAGHVAMTGELLNIHDAYAHPLFYKGIDENTGFKTRNILCIPIKNEKQVIGVAQLCNKINGVHFTSFDEEIALAFSVYCAISIAHSLMLKKVQDAQSRSKLSNELMMYHMKVSNEDTKKLISNMLPVPGPEFADFKFSPRSLKESNTAQTVLYMLDDLGLVQRWRIKRETLARFILYVQRGYRDPPYHNWMHAFSVAHFAYLLLKNLHLMEKGHITELEGLVFIVACMCHDLDHRGTTNSFQLASDSVLAGLYSSEGSVMERHHFSQAMCILNTEGCNIFESLQQAEYKKCLDLLRHLILATDLAQHLRIFNEQKKLTEDGYDSSNEHHRGLLLSLLMTCCDLSDQTKTWSISKKIAELIYMEFFSQGDLEKAMGNRPSEMMDREKACIPFLQLQFLNDIVHPLFTFLAELFPEAECLVDALKINKRCWETAWELYSKRLRKESSSMAILEDEQLEIEVINYIQANEVV